MGAHHGRVALPHRRRAALVGWAGVLLFRLALLLVGWWAWWYAVPALAVLVVLAGRDRRKTRG